MPNKKIVLDTNGLISSLSRRGQFYPIWRSFQQGRYTLCISNEILDEYIEIISQKMTPEIAENVEKALRLCVENEYLGLHPNQDFVIVMREKGLFVGKKGNDTYFVNKTAQHQPLYAERSVDGHFYILVIDEVTGAFCIPRCWKHIIRIKDHKEYLIPGGHKPNKDGWID